MRQLWMYLVVILMGVATPSSENASRRLQQSLDHLLGSNLFRLFFPQVRRSHGRALEVPERRVAECES